MAKNRKNSKTSSNHISRISDASATTMKLDEPEAHPQDLHDYLVGYTYSNQYKDGEWSLVRLPYGSKQMGAPITEDQGHSDPIECLLEGESRRILDHQPAFSSELPSAIPNSYYIAGSPGKELGMFAARPLRTGDVIIVERPLIIRPYDLPLRPMDSSKKKTLYTQPRADEEEHVMTALFERLSARNKAIYLDLHNSQYAEVFGQLTGIFMTNMVDLGGLFGPACPDVCRYAGVFKDISRINHSCSPNAVKHWDKRSFAFIVHVARDIAADEEITLPYCALYEPAAKRRNILQAFYHFWCKCDACCNSAASDARRAELLKNRYKLKNVTHWAADPTLPDDYCLEAYLRHARLLEQENLQSDGIYWQILACITTCYSALGDFEEMTKASEKMVPHYQAAYVNEGDLSSMRLAVEFKYLWRARLRTSKEEAHRDWLDRLVT
ncbi:hypothetical protein HGRIS_006624 [Hohenbuehelia grisea]|uniref:SET domain-containing protein n=1 Tax=Hohenbuehelia grisea TaxID=104357 RepID=A0ABR3JA62_9AGAR